MLSEEVRARVETALISITEDALRERIRHVMLRAARTEAWKRRHGWSPCSRCGALASPGSNTETPALCSLCRAGVGEE